jgi:hypothetical protein
MKGTVRVLLLACTSVAALTFAGGALAAFTPTLSVSARPASPGAPGLSSIQFTVPRDDDALARVRIFVPAGHTASLGQAVGTELGSVTAQVRLREPIEGLVLPISGTIRVADPTAALPQTPTSTIASSVTDCTGTATHAALWVLAVQASGREVHVPVAVDAASAPFSAFASHFMTICLSNPNIPQDAGGAPLGLKLINARLNLRNILTLPAQPGDHVWRAIATPWPAGPGAPVAANTREARAHIALPASATVRVASGRKTGRFRTVTVSGAVREQARGIAGASVRVAVGSAARTVRTSANGSYRATFRLRTGRRYTASVRATVGERTAASACSTPGPFQASTPAVPCATETLPYYEPAPTGAPPADSTSITASRAFRVR